MQNVEVNQELSNKLLSVIELIQEGKRYKKKKNDMCYQLNKIQNSTQILKGKSLGKICTDLIVKSIANHRFNEASKLLWMLTQDPYCFAPSLFNAMMNVLLNLEISSKNEAIWKTMCSMQTFSIMNKREIRLEYLMFMLKNDINNAQRSFLELSSLIRSTVFKKHAKLDPIFVAYADFLDYINLTKAQYGDLSTQSQEILGKVRLAFKNFVENAGEWDIFIIKLVKVLELCDQENEIEDLLFKFLLIYAHLMLEFYG